MYSICIPTYNRSDLISKAINSVLSQTLNDFELLIHDNSEDNKTELVIKSFTDERIKYYRHPENIGMIANWNSLLYASKGEFVKFLNDDDIMLPKCLKVADNHIKSFEEKFKTKPSLITLAANYCDIHGTLLKRDHRINSGGNRNYYVASTDIPFLWCYDAVPIRTPTHSIYHTETVKNIGGFDKTIIWIADVDLGVRMASIQGNLILDEVPLVEFLIHEGQETNTMSMKTRINEQKTLKQKAYSQVVDKAALPEFSEFHGEIILKEFSLMVRDRLYFNAWESFKKWITVTHMHGLKRYIDHNLKRNSDFSKYYKDI